MVREQRARLDANAFRPLTAAQQGGGYVRRGVQWHSTPQQLGSRRYMAPAGALLAQKHSLPTGIVVEVGPDGAVELDGPAGYLDHMHLLSRGFRSVTDAMGNQFVADYKRSRQRGEPDMVGFLERGAAASAIAAGDRPFHGNRIR
jgi:hypothetical protein